ncbi:MAG TPA: hypothetical protein VH682_01270 [Gemmataceae bacterium]|jgi:hypothetical protein
MRQTGSVLFCFHGLLDSIGWENDPGSRPAGLVKGQRSFATETLKCADRDAGHVRQLGDREVTPAMLSEERALSAIRLRDILRM